MTAQDQAGTLRVSAVAPTPLPADQVCQLWMVTEARKPVPLGILPQNGSRVMSVPGVVSQDGRFLVSVEAVSLAPVRRPSAEIVFEGRPTRI